MVLKKLKLKLHCFRLRLFISHLLQNQEKIWFSQFCFTPIRLTVKTLFFLAIIKTGLHLQLKKIPFMVINLVLP